MRKRKKGRSLSLKTDQRRALLRSLAEAIFNKEKIETTEAKAKEASILVEKLITTAKKNNTVSIKTLGGLFSKKLVKKIMTEIAPRYQQRNGGCTRIIKMGPRNKDGAKMAIIELIK
jgi:large subunit ribosomal protein L17